VASPGLFPGVGDASQFTKEATITFAYIKPFETGFTDRPRIFRIGE
jgi:hypothetical protein